MNRPVAIVNSLQLKYLRRRATHNPPILRVPFAEACPELPHCGPTAGLKLKLLTDVFATVGP